MKTKQVIVVRKDLGMRKGKMIAQGAHAAMGAYLVALKDKANDKVLRNWTVESCMTKICVGVDSEKELLKIYNQAITKGFPACLVKDAGKTEFKEPTYTAVAIGPDNVEDIDKITGDMELL